MIIALNNKCNLTKEKFIEYQEELQKIAEVTGGKYISLFSYPDGAEFQAFVMLASAFYIICDISYKAYKKCYIAYFSIDNISYIVYNNNYEE